MADLEHAYKNKNASGWSVPMSDRHAKTRYNSTLASLYEYYARANEDLYSLMKSLGPSSGWTGRFPDAPAKAATQEEHGKGSSARAASGQKLPKRSAAKLTSKKGLDVFTI